MDEVEITLEYAKNKQKKTVYVHQNNTSRRKIR